MMVCSMMLFAACSSNTPSGAVEKVYDKLIEGDYEGFLRELYVEDKSDPEQLEKEIKDFAKMMRNNRKNHEDEALKSYEILKEEPSRTGKWVRVTIKEVNVKGEEKESSVYVTKDNDGVWKMLLIGTDRLMDE